MNNITFFEQLPLTLRVNQVAQLLDISKNKAYSLVRTGEIRSIRIGRTYRIPREALAEYFAKKLRKVHIFIAFSPIYGIIYMYPMRQRKEYIYAAEQKN